MQNPRRMLVIYGLFFLVLIGWPIIQEKLFPTKAKAKYVPAIAAGSLYLALNLIDDNPTLKKAWEEFAEADRAKRIAEAQKEAAPKAKEEAKAVEPKKVDQKKEDIGSLELIGMGHGRPSHLKVLLSTRGAGVQQVILNQFQGATRLGLAAKNSDGTPIPLHLIPGIVIPRTKTLAAQDNEPVPELKPGKVEGNAIFELTPASYRMYHYEKPADEAPSGDLGLKNWKIVEQQVGSEHETEKVVFETELQEPHFLKIRKTFTLKANEYHLGCTVQIEKLPGYKPERAFRYQIETAQGTPVEGEWYTTTYRVAMTGLIDKNETVSRVYEDSREIRHSDGSERHVAPQDGRFTWTGIATQFFASTLAIDPDQGGKKNNFIQYVRATPIGARTKDQQFLDDITTRAISEELRLNEPVEHRFLLYQGPVKVRLLRQLSADRAIDPELKANFSPVPEETITKYLDELHLDKLTDAPFPNFFGRFANSIGWTWLVIKFTNLIHGLLSVLTGIIPVLGFCILIVTVMVRGSLIYFSRKQAIASAKMQAQMAKLAPELKKIQEKYEGDFHKLQEAKMKLYRENGVNPAGMMGGCFLLLLQMPVFMGLYYALQESVFFRLESFLWMPNLAAPDMLFSWGEGIPIISDPTGIGGILYLGPFMNILPLVSVALMLYQQKKMMPVSEDPQIQAQQNMMKWMMLMMAVFFYKMPGGLCLYFIASTLWGITERKLLPKTVHQHKETDEEPKPPKELKGMRKWMANKMKDLMEQAETQRQIRNQGSADGPIRNDRNGPQRPDRKNPKKKR
jgi:YidC/Oxa1 family membrane protein insertase